MTCSCLCAASHPEQGICDVQAPPALLVMDLAGSLLAGLGETASQCSVSVCLPCGQATLASNPRARDLVAVDDAE